MSNRTNLVYNGDFSKGTDSWNTTAGASKISAANNILTVDGGDLYQSKDYLFPVAAGRTYSLTFDLKVNRKDSYPFYIALRPYDNTKTIIARARVYKPIANCDTTLAEPLNNGDTTVTLTNATNWPSTRTYQGIGICDKLAWGYNRCTYRQAYTSKSGNVITLTAAWSGGAFPVGTKVSNFEAGSTYDYPKYIANADIPTEWTSYSCTFTTDTLMYSCQYVQFGTLGYSMNYSMRNIRVECIDDIQLNHWEDKSVDLTKQGVLTSPEFNDIGMPIRYIRDTIDGSTANTNNHWNEIEVYNYVGANIAWGKDFNGHANTVVTDGLINGNYTGTTGVTNVGSADGTITLDLGFVENIHKIKIWHYYPDGRTYYNNVTEVSVDGTNWITVYKGQKPETAAGNEIILTSPTLQLHKNGEVFCNELIEL